MREELCPECEMELDDDEFEIEKFRCPRCGKVFELAVWEGEANKKDAEEVFNRCMEISGFPEELKHRIIWRFGFFLQEMVNYLVWEELSKDNVLSEFQQTIDRDKYDPEKFDSYLELFEKFYEWMDKDV